MTSLSRSTGHERRAERRWPMAMAIIAAGLLRAALPAPLRVGEARWLLLVVLLVLLTAMVVGDPGRIDRTSRTLRALTVSTIGFITVVNASAAVRLIVDIVNGDSFTNDAKVLLAAGGAIWLTNAICFALWYWDLDRGGAAARARNSGPAPAFVFPEMTNEQWVVAGWYPRFVDYFHLAFATATAFSPTDVSAIRPWAKLLMIAEETVSLVVALLVIARAVNILS